MKIFWDPQSNKTLTLLWKLNKNGNCDSTLIIINKCERHDICPIAKHMKIIRRRKWEKEEVGRHLKEGHFEDKKQDSVGGCHRLSMKGGSLQVLTPHLTADDPIPPHTKPNHWQ